MRYKINYIFKITLKIGKMVSMDIHETYVTKLQCFIVNVIRVQSYLD